MFCDINVFGGIVLGILAIFFFFLSLYLITQRDIKKAALREYVRSVLDGLYDTTQGSIIPVHEFKEYGSRRAVIREMERQLRRRNWMCAVSSDEDSGIRVGMFKN